MIRFLMDAKHCWLIAWKIDRIVEFNKKITVLSVIISLTCEGVRVYEVIGRAYP